MIRVSWIDNAKFIGIFLVVLGHLPIPEYAINFIYSFHMPLFFFISGYLFDVNKYDSFFKFFKHRFRQLLVPYFFFNVITYFFWLLIGRRFGNDSSADISVFTPIIGIFYGTDTGNYLIHCGSLWFLPCLFLVEIIYYMFIKVHKGLLLLLLTLIGYINFRIDHVMLPWSFDVALVAIFFYCVSDILKSAINKGVKIKVIYKLLIVLASLFLHWFLINLTGRSDMSSNTYNNYFLFLITALNGIVIIVLFSSLIADLIQKIPLIEYFARNTIIILSFHGIVASIIKGLLLFLFKIPVNEFNGSLGMNIVYTVLTFIILIPVFFVFERYLPFMLGKIKNKKAI